jgi:uncharacterized protein
MGQELLSMKIGIVSDIHDNLWNLAAALRMMGDAGTLICCGDLCSPFVIAELAKFSGDVHVVFGNNDADLYRITLNAAKHANVHLHGELFRETFGGRRVNHFDYIARPIANSGEFDVVCFGHNHELEITRTDRGCLLLNPGPILGAKFAKGWEDVPSTFLCYDTETGEAAVRQVTEAKTSA